MAAEQAVVGQAAERDEIIRPRQCGQALLYGSGQLHFCGVGAGGVQLDKLALLRVQCFAQIGRGLQLGADGRLHRLHGSGAGLVLGQLVQRRLDRGIDIAAELPQGRSSQHEHCRQIKFYEYAPFYWLLSA